MSDHIKALFEGQELSEEFKSKATVIVESLIEEKTKELKESLEVQLQESYDAKLAERTSELEELAQKYIAEEVLPQIDKYLTLAVNEWEVENRVALEESAKVSLADSFLTGLVGLAESHKLTIKEGEFEKAKTLEAELAQLKESIVEIKVRNSELVAENQKYVRDAVLGELTESLSASQRDKLVPVVEKVEFKNVEQFSEAVKSLVQSYFPINEADKDDEDGEDDDKEEKDKDTKDEKKDLKESTDPYLNALSQMLN